VSFEIIQWYQQQADALQQKAMVVDSMSACSTLSADFVSSTNVIKNFLKDQVEHRQKESLKDYHL
jgi:hypothetical protein